jgi:hypothetical protein
MDSNGNLETGSGAAPSGQDDGVIIKYSPSGSKVWAKQISAAGGTYVNVYGLQCAPNGNVYFFGVTDANLLTNTGPSTGPQDVFLMAFDPNGNRLWTKQYGLAANSPQTKWSAMDSSGNFYGVLYTDGSVFGSQIGTQDTVVVKFDSSGNLVWSKHFGHAGLAFHPGTIEVKRDGSAIYVAGAGAWNLETNSAPGGTIGTTPIFLAKLDSDGNQVWLKNKTIDADLNPAIFGIALDETSNTIYTAWNIQGDWNTGGGSSSETVFVSYTDNGSSVTQGTVSTQYLAPASKILIPCRLALSADKQSLYTELGATGTPTNITGAPTFVGTSSNYIVKLDVQTLSVQWITLIGVSGKFVSSQALSLDASGNVVFSGYSNANTSTMSGASLGNTTEFYIRSVSPAGILN